MTVAKIKKQSGSWLSLPVPVSLQPSINALDSSKSGRDNNTGAMFRDKIAEKLKYSIEFPSGLNNTEVAEILDVLLEGSFVAWLPNPKTGAYSEKSFYCSAAEPAISRIFSESYWIYNSFTVSATEM